MRNELNLSIKDFANLCNITTEPIIQSERYNKILSPKILQKISCATNISISYLGGFDVLPENTLHEQFIKAVYCNGHTQKDLVKILNINQETIIHYLQGKITSVYRYRIENYVDKYLYNK